MKLISKEHIFMVLHYVWCAAVTNIFIAGLVYTASLAGAQVNAVKELREFKAGIIEGATAAQAGKDLEDDLTGRRRLK